MKLFLKIVGFGILAIVALVVIAFVSITAIANNKVGRKHSMPVVSVPNIPTDSASIERGRHLATAVGNCVECHGEDLGGRLFMDAGPIGIAAGTNLTRGRGGIGATFTDADYVRAIKYGLRADSTSLLVMPSESFAYLSDADLGSLIAYVRQIPPVDREVQRTALGPLGKVLAGTGALPVFAAELVRLEPSVPVTPGVTVEYGSYMANISGCRGCHGLNLAGGIEIGPPGTPPSANLTPAGPSAKWSEEEFFRAFREGKRPDGTMISDFMPWKTMARMTDDELRAILMYLRSVPALETRSK